MGEVKVVDPKTGAEKGSKLARFSLIPPEFLFALAEHYGKGARKYADRNWEKGYNWSLSIDALERHLNQFKMGQFYDDHTPECDEGCVEHTGSHHLICVAWHACALFCYYIFNRGTDDVTKRPLNG